MANEIDFNKNNHLILSFSNTTYKISNYNNLIYGNDLLSNLLSQILFLTLYWDTTLLPNPILLYVGSANCIHLNILSELFPTFEYHLYDTEPFDTSLLTNNKLKIYNKEFNNDDYEQWSSVNKRIFFISTALSMNSQKKIIDNLNPNISFIRFSIPNIKSYNYFNGLIMFKQFNDSRTLDSNLIVFNSLSSNNWDYNAYYNQLTYHNFLIRNSSYSLFNFEKWNLLDYDNVCFVYILIQYLIKTKINISDSNINLLKTYLFTLFPINLFS